MNIVNVLALGVGGILIYSAVKDDNPVNVIKTALNGGATKPKDAPASPPTTGGGGGGGVERYRASSYVQPIPVTPNPPFVSV